MTNTPITSEQMRYTAQEMRNSADNCDWRTHPCIAAMLRQAADAEEELTKLHDELKDAKMTCSTEKCPFDLDTLQAANHGLYNEVKSLKERLAAIVKECERKISFYQKLLDRCEMCWEDSSAGEDCPYHGEPNGCNSPTYGEFPTEEECEPLVTAILRLARGEVGTK